MSRLPERFLKADYDEFCVQCDKHRMLCRDCNKCDPCCLCPEPCALCGEFGALDVAPGTRIICTCFYCNGPKCFRQVKADDGYYSDDGNRYCEECGGKVGI